MKAGLLALILFIVAAGLLIWLFFRLVPAASWNHVLDFGAGITSLVLVTIGVGILIEGTGPKNESRR